ncbi:hypothetical protein [Acaryochloris thomasi]|uniref:hypothetical protein n=1 Tax=Acaryochloris thomasi TaxID=2929456 RepID=UPI001313F8E2|nr:hypothetical protein [Acaryochloris thomasi]
MNHDFFRATLFRVANYYHELPTGSVGFHNHNGASDSEKIEGLDEEFDDPLPA